ncbi:Uncharacterized protein PBTT_08036 [Plasmodiophora brassicae]
MGAGPSGPSLDDDKLDDAIVKDESSQDDPEKVIDRTGQQKKVDPAKKARAAALVDECIRDFDRLFDVGFEGLGKSQADLLRQVQQVVFLRGTIRLHSALRTRFDTKTQSFVVRHLEQIHRGDTANWEAIHGAYKRMLSTIRPAKRILMVMPLDVLFSVGNGNVFNAMFPYMTISDRGRLACVSRTFLAAMNTRVEWRALSMLAWIGETYRIWFDAHMGVLVETLHYLDLQHAMRNEKSHVEFLMAGQHAFKTKVDAVLPLRDDERAYWRQNVFGYSLSAKQRLHALMHVKFFRPILTEHFIKMARHSI